MSVRLILVLLFIPVLGMSIYVFLSGQVEKPDISKPEFSEGKSERLEQVHIQYIANEMGTYMLHPDPITSEKPSIEIYITDENRSFFVTVDNNVPSVSEEPQVDVDLRLRGKSINIIKLLKSENLEEDVVSMINSGELQIELISDEKTLLLKGYKAIYDLFSS